MLCFQSYPLLEIMFLLLFYNLKAFHFIGHFIKKKKEEKNESSNLKNITSTIKWQG